MEFSREYERKAQRCVRGRRKGEDRVQRCVAGNGCLFDDCCLDDADVVKRAVIAVCFNPLDAIYDVESFNDLSEDGVLSVEVGSSSIALIGFAEFGCKFHLAVCCIVEPVLHLVEHIVAHAPAPNDVELVLGRLAVGVGFVALTCRRNASAFVEDFGETYFGRNLFSFFRLAEHLAGYSVAAERVASLNHEVWNDTVEEHAVVNAFVDVFQEIVAVKRSFVVELNADVAAVGFKKYLRTGKNILREGRKRKKKEKRENELFHWCFFTSMM